MICGTPRNRFGARCDACEEKRRAQRVSGGYRCFSARVPAKLVRALHRASSESNLNISQIVEEALLEHLEARAAPGSAAMQSLKSRDDPATNG